MSAAIEARGLTKRYGSFVAVEALDLRIDEGTVFGVLGPNGSGKTTTILMLMGLTEVSAGSVRVRPLQHVEQLHRALDEGERVGAGAPGAWTHRRVTPSVSQTVSGSPAAAAISASATAPGTRRSFFIGPSSES